MNSTIVAPATPPGESALAVVRMSGPDALEIAARTFRRGSGRMAVSATEFASRRLYYGFVVDTAGAQADEVMLAAMRAPRSYTGEDVVEITCHGGGATVRAVLGILVAAGAAPAEPGEFTRRAFLNGRIDLARAEAVMDVIQAKGDAARRAALRQLAGGLSQEVEAIGTALTGLLAEVEARIDFPEEDLGNVAEAQVSAEIAAVRERIARLTATADRGRRLREGLRVVLAGKPNAGKSSLLNALLRFERAIVSAQPGTTRDFLEETVVLGGLPLVLVDTAGIRPTDDSIEAEGAARAVRQAEMADLVLVVLDAASGFTADDLAVCRAVPPGVDQILVVNKVDLEPGKSTAGEAVAVAPPGTPLRFVSARTGEGLGELETLVANRYAPRLGEEPIVTSLRHEAALRRAHAALGEAAASLGSGRSPDVVAVDLREAWEAVGAVTGRAASEEVVAEVFRRFCIGK